MGLQVVQGETQFRVAVHKVRAFERVFEQARLDDYWMLTKDAQGAIVGIELRGLPGSPCEYSAMAKLTPFVEVGSYVTLETAWGDDAWRWTFRGSRMTERTIAAGMRAR
jgi:hypothetical protein